jgi:hypothetical protein
VRGYLGTGVVGADAYETVHTVSCIQGIVNRNTPNLWVNYTAIDPYWLEYVQSRGWPAQSVTYQPLGTVADIVTQFSSMFSGAVVYDPRTG